MSKTKYYVCTYKGRYFQSTENLIQLLDAINGCSVFKKRTHVHFYDKKTGDVGVKYKACKRIRTVKELNNFIRKTDSLTEVAFGFFNIR